MKIECTYGPVSTEVMGTTYTFAPDENGKNVAEVWDPKHIKSLLAVVHYRALDDQPTPEEPEEPIDEPDAPEEPLEDLGTEEPVEEPVDDRGDIAVTEISGIGPTTAAKLAEAGITDARQIAALSPEDAEALDAQLGLGGKIAREDWVGQAKALTA